MSMGDAYRNAGSRIDAAGGLVPPMMEPSGQGKVPMGDAAYRQAEGPERSCATCAHFLPMGDRAECEIVAGDIDPAGVSDFWEPAQRAEGLMLGGG